MVVQSKCSFCIRRMDALYRNYKMRRSIFQGAWSGIEPESTPSTLFSLKNEPWRDWSVHQNLQG